MHADCMQSKRTPISNFTPSISFALRPVDSRQRQHALEDRPQADQDNEQLEKL
jgi:hypothetical protein